MKLKLRKMYYYGYLRKKGTYSPLINEYGMVSLYFGPSKNDYKNKITFKTKIGTYAKYEKLLKERSNRSFELIISGVKYVPGSELLIEETLIEEIGPSITDLSHDILVESVECFQFKGVLKHDDSGKLGSTKPRQFELVMLLGMESDVLITGKLWAKKISGIDEDGTYFFDDNKALKKMRGILYDCHWRGKLMNRSGKRVLYFTDFKYGDVKFELNKREKEIKEWEELSIESQRIFEEQESANEKHNDLTNYWEQTYEERLVEMQNKKL